MSDEKTIVYSDPSELTTQLVWREVQHLKELMEARITGVEKGIQIAHQDLVRVPTDVEKAVATLKALHGEKFASIEKQFNERDVRVEQTARDTKTAVDAALAAQEKAVGKQTETFEAATSKSELAFTKQIDQQGELLRTEVRGIVTRIDELKDRLNRGDGHGEGITTNKAEMRGTLGVYLIIAGLIISVGGIVVAAILRP